VELIGSRGGEEEEEEEARAWYQRCYWQYYFLQWQQSCTKLELALATYDLYMLYQLLYYCD